MKLIVGLGNPGNQYAHSRHNIGFMCISHFAKTRSWDFEKKEGLARTAHGRLNGEEIVKRHLVLSRYAQDENRSGSPSLSLEDKTPGRGPRMTVGVGEGGLGKPPRRGFILDSRV